MARIILSALLTLILTLMSGCSDPQPPLNPTLVRADSLMEPAPDSALALLDTIDRTIFLPADSDLYALLLTQAAVKNNRPLRSDTLIRRARRAYRLHGPHSLRRRAAFYSALSYYRRGHLPSAMSDALNAYELAKSESNPYWTAKAAELIADIFRDAFNNPEAIKYTHIAINQYAKAGKIANHRYAICDLATSLYNQARFNDGLNLLDSLEHVVKSEHPIDENLYLYLIDVKTPTLIALGQLDTARQLQEHIKNYYNPKSADDIFEITLHDCYLDSDSLTDRNLQKLGSLANNTRDIARATYASYEIAFQNGDYQHAAYLCDSLLDIQSKIASEILSESVTAVLRDYYITESNKFQNRNRELRLIIICICSLFLIIATSTYYIFHLKLKTKRAELATSLKDLVSLQNEHSIFAEKNAALFKGQWHTLNTLCNSYFDLDKPEDKRTALLRKIEQELSKIKKAKNLSELENAINSNCNDLMAQIRQECSFLEETDFTLLTLIFSGFSAQVVCLLTDIKYKNFYLKKARLKKKIANSDAPHRDYFISQL